METVYSMADLRDIVGINSTSTVQLLGYYEPGDGGGGLFYWDVYSTEDDNYGTIIETNLPVATGRWKRNFDGAVSVKWFGAIGNGQVDDTLKIQKVIDSYDDIFIPSGQYNVEGLIINRNRVKLSGESYTQSILYALTDNQPFVLLVGFDPFVYGVIEEVDISNLKIDGAYKAIDGVRNQVIFSNIEKISTTSVKRFGINHLMGYSTRYCDCKSSYSGRAGLGVYQEGNLLQFDRCTFSNNPLGAGVEFISGSTPTFQSCSFENNGKQGVLLTWQTDEEITFPPYVDTQVECVSIHGCYFENNGTINKSLYANIDFKGELDGIHKIRNCRVQGVHFGLTGDEIAVNFDYGFENIDITSSGFYYVSSPRTIKPIQLSIYYTDSLRRSAAKIDLSSGNNLLRDDINVVGASATLNDNIASELISLPQYVTFLQSGLTFTILKNCKQVFVSIKGTALTNIEVDVNTNQYGIICYTRERYYLKSIANDGYDLVTRPSSEFNGFYFKTNSSTAINEQVMFFTE